jgi:hypothetical protein
MAEVKTNHQEWKHSEATMGAAIVQSVVSIAKGLSKQ